MANRPHKTTHNGNRVALTEKDIRAYLDECIIFWRNKKAKAGTGTEQQMSSHYIDAYQSVRTSLFGETLPVGDDG